MFGRSPRLPIDSVFGIEPNEGDQKMQVSYAKYVQEWEQSMNQAFEIANRNAGNSRDRNKMYYDKKVHGVDINVRDRVLLRNRQKGGTRKLKSYWEDTVYLVTAKDAEIPVYTIKPECGNGHEKRVHRNNIMNCNSILPKKEKQRKRISQEL